MKNFLLIPSKIVIFFIKVYQFFLSPDHSFWAKKFYSKGYCKFYPSCSEYGCQSIKKHGLFVGGVKTVWRVLRCNPWSLGGVDKP